MKGVRLLFSLMVSWLASSAWPAAPDDCRTQIVISPEGLAKAADASLSYFFAVNPDFIQNSVNAGLAKETNSTPPKSHKMSKRLLGIGFDDGAMDATVDARVELSHMHLEEVKTLTPKITCIGKRCKISVAISSLKFVADVRVQCVDPKACNPNPPIDIRQASLAFNMDDHPDQMFPTLEYDIERKPAGHLNEYFNVVPNSGKILNLDYALAKQIKVGIEMNAEEKVRAADVEKTYLDFYKRERSKIQLNCPPSVNPSEQALLLNEKWSEIREAAIREKYKDFLRTPASLTYFGAIKDFTDEQRQGPERPLTPAQKSGQGEIAAIYDDFMQTVLAPIIGEGLSTGLHAAPLLNRDINFSIPLQTVKKAVDEAENPDLRSVSKRKKAVPGIVTAPRKGFEMTVVGAGTDEDQNAVFDVSGCKDRPVSANANTGVVEPIFDRRPGLNPPAGFDAAFSIDIGTLNEYLRESFADPDQNSLLARPISKKNIIRKVGLDPVIEETFLDPPSFYIKFDTVPVLDKDNRPVLDPKTGKVKTRERARPVLHFTVTEHKYSTFLTKYIHVFDKKVGGEGEVVLKRSGDPSKGEKIQKRIVMEFDPGSFSRQPDWSQADKVLGFIAGKALLGVLTDPIVNIKGRYPGAIKDKVGMNLEEMFGFDVIQLEASPSGKAINGAGKLNRLYEVLSQQLGEPVPE